MCELYQYMCKIYIYYDCNSLLLLKKRLNISYMCNNHQNNMLFIENVFHQYTCKHKLHDIVVK